MQSEILGRTIRQKRLELKMTQEKLSGLADISLRQYVRIETGQQTPDLLTIFKISNALNSHYSELLEDVFISHIGSDLKK